MLSNFLKRSLEEDDFGILQRFIPQILSGLTELLTKVEEFSERFVGQFGPNQGNLLEDKIWKLQIRSSPPPPSLVSEGAY